MTGVQTCALPIWRSVQNWERPDASVPWDRLPEIARLTEVKVEWLLGAQQTADVTGDEATRLREEMRVLREELLKELDHQRQEVARAVLASVQEALGVTAEIQPRRHADIID